MFRTTLLAALPLVVLSCVVAPALANDVHEGKVVSVGTNSITIQDKDGNHETFTLAEDCQITHGGKPATLKDIDDGDIAKVTVKTVKGKLLATVIEAMCPV